MKQVSQELNVITAHADSKSGWSCLTLYILMRGNIYRITQHAYKYKDARIVEICKETNNPYGGRIGKSYASWNLAVKAYKSPEMQAALMLAESDFLSFEIKTELQRLAANN